MENNTSSAKKITKKPKKKPVNGKKKKKKNSLFAKICIVLAIVLAFFLIFKLVKNKNQDKVETVSQTIEKQDVKTETKVEIPEQKSEKKNEKQEKIAEEKKKNTEKQEKKAAETKAVEQSITGTWMSTTGGAVLTMKDFEYRFDFMGIDSDQPIIGTYSVDGDIITFVNKKDPCKDVKGLYEVKFNKNEIAFKCKNDDCTKRKAILPTDWEWLDTDE